MHRVHDRELDRPVAMKILQPGASPQARAGQRFLTESRLTAGLQHPAIPPVFDRGALPDGRWYFTLQEIIGRTLKAVMAELV